METSAQHKIISMIKIKATLTSSHFLNNEAKRIKKNSIKDQTVI